MSKSIINLHDIERHGTRALGPGLRYVVWMQGCPFDCAGCTTPAAKPIIPMKMMEVDALAADIITNRHITGITISGGEPFLQAESLEIVLRQVKAARPEFDVIVFTGFKIQNLKSSAALFILAMTDLLIDGPYIDSLNDGIGLRGSSNQRLHFLTDRLLPYKEELLTGKRQIEIRFNHKQANINAIGIPLKKPKQP